MDGQLAPQEADYPLAPITNGFWTRVAHHEAGHAVAQIVIRRALHNPPPPFRCVFIRPGATGPYYDRDDRLVGDIAGSVEGPSFFVPRPLPYPKQYHKFSTPAACVLAEYEILVRMAGPYAEARSLGAETDSEMQEIILFGDEDEGDCGGALDFDYAWRDVYPELCAMAGRKVSTEELEARARKLVSDNWPAIRALADRLMVQHELSYNEALAVVGPFLLPPGHGGGLRHTPFTISRARSTYYDSRY